MLHIPFRARIEVVDAQHLVPALEQAVAQVRADEAGSTGDDNALRLSYHLLTTVPKPACYTCARRNADPEQRHAIPA